MPTCSQCDSTHPASACPYAWTANPDHVANHLLSQDRDYHEQEYPDYE